MLDGKTILITGGTGSFGQAMTAYLLKNYYPEAIRIFSRGELLQVTMAQQFSDPRLHFIIGDVRDPQRVRQAMTGVDIAIHAAALKHVPIGEANPSEVIKTNIMGTMNVIDAAMECGVDRVMLISSDKAVQPVNAYGATKMLAEKLFIQANDLYGNHTKFSCVRYGNVVASRGSVILVWREQAKTGTITLTDDRMTRFWITMDQAVRFVASCLIIMSGGEIFVPKLPSATLTDLAEAVAPGCKQKVTGIRLGEKLHETLISAEEICRTIFSCEAEFYLIRKSDTILWYGEPYASNTNSHWLTVEQMKEGYGEIRGT